jgi:hypothetical protein
VSFRRSDHVFVVRTWLESPDDPRTMRGQVDHLRSGRRRYFANFGDLCDFIVGAGALVPADESVAEGPGDGAVDGPGTVPV